MSTAPLDLRLFETAPGNYTVVIGRLFCGNLWKDEALGIVAQALYGSDPSQYLTTYEQWRARTDRWNRSKPAPTLMLPAPKGGAA